MIGRRWSRTAGSSFGRWFIPTDGMPDAYAAAHVSYSLGERLPRFSLATHVDSPRLRTNYASTPRLLDPRNVDGPELPWSVAVRGAVEQAVGERVGVRLVVTAQSLSTEAADNRIGDLVAPSPRGGLGMSSNPVAPLSAMLEVNFRL